MKIMWLMLCKLAVNVAVTLLPLTETVQLLPETLLQPPVQPPKPNPGPGVAVSVTLGTLGNDAEQVLGQLMPVGMLATTPDPGPARFTVIWDAPCTNP